MNRRELIALLGGAAAAPVLSQWAARAQPGVMPVVGWLNGGSPGNYAEVEAAFRDGLSETGFVEGRNVVFEYRFAEGRYERLRTLASGLARDGVAAIFASSSGAAVAAKSATATIPIVFAGASDPVQLGLVPGLNRPGGNVTGATMFSHLLSAKRLEMVHQLAANSSATAILLNGNNPSSETELQYLQVAARDAGWQTVACDARDAGEIDKAFASAAEQKAGALLVLGDPLFTTRRDQIVALAARHSLIANYPLRTFTAAGGLSSYGASFNSVARLGGLYIGRILKGEKAGELPVVLPTKFNLVINLSTAKALGVEFPPTLLALADEVIE
jgi:ABC-type uncharacterized transport system substrate-binding protein